jgi:CRP/FNR family transcriptional regulator, cyclic AMP receptor protein
VAHFLESLTAEERTALEAIGRRRRFPRGVALFREGDDAGAVYVVLEGWVKITVFGPEGREVLLALRGAGDLIGELSVLGDEGRSATVTAADEVDTIAVPGAAFRAWAERHPRIALALLRLSTERLFAADRRAIDFASFDVLGRVARRLGELAETTGRQAPDGLEIAVPLTQEELAGWTGASREAVSRALSTLRALGWIAVERRRITILDAEALSRHTIH